MSYKFNPFTRTLDYYQKIVGGLTTSLSDMEIYVDGSSGSDTTGDGSASAPYATIPKAYENVPYWINHKVSLRIAAGSYSSFPSLIRNDCGPDGQFLIEGFEAATVLASSLTATGHTHYKGAMLVTVSGAGWTPGEWRGKFISIDGSGYIVPIFDNTADTLVLIYSFAFPLTGTTFDIGGCLGSNASQYGVVNFWLKTTDAQPYIFKGDALGIWCLSGLEVPATKDVLLMTAGGINAIGALDSSEYTVSAYATGWISGFQLAQTGFPDTSSEIVSITPGKSSINGGISCASTCCLGGLNLVANQTDLIGIVAGHIKADHGVHAVTSYSAVSVDSSYTIPAVTIDDASTFEVDNFTILQAPRDGVEVSDMGKGIFSAFDNAAPATRYLWNVARGCTVSFKTTTATGTTNDIYFTGSAAGHSKPASGSSVNDSEMSFVLAL